MKTLVLGDVHGAYKALMQVFERSNFDKENDELIVLGDVADGWPEVNKCIDELLSVKKLITIMGNHDLWLLDWFVKGLTPEIWTGQGGLASMKSYGYARENVSPSHIQFFKDANYFYIDEKNRLFVHGGFDNKRKMEDQNPTVLMWDRNLIQTAKAMHYYLSNFQRKVTQFEEVFLGHTTTQLFCKDCKPLHFCEVWDIDTGAGWSGKLTLMNVDTHEFYQSNYVYKLYPNEKGRH